MEKPTELLATILKHYHRGRITYDMLRRFAECPERIRSDWSLKTADEQLDEMQTSGSGVSYTSFVGEALALYTNAQTLSRARYTLIMARKAFAIGAKHGFDLVLARECANHCGKLLSKCCVHDPHISEEARVVYREIAEFITGWLRGDRLSPYETMIRYHDTRDGLFNAILYAADTAYVPEYRDTWTEHKLEKVANFYWLRYLERAFVISGD